MSLGTFFRDEVALPLRLDFHIGVDPKHDDRIATMYTAHVSIEIARQMEQRQQEVQERMSSELLGARANISIQCAPASPLERVLGGHALRLSFRHYCGQHLTSLISLSHPMDCYRNPQRYELSYSRLIRNSYTKVAARRAVTSAWS